MLVKTFAYAIGAAESFLQSFGIFFDLSQVSLACIGVNNDAIDEKIATLSIDKIEEVTRETKLPIISSEHKWKNFLGFGL